MEFTITMGEMQQTVIYTVQNVTQTSYIMNVTMTSPFGGGPVYSEQEWPKDATMGSDFDLSNPPTGMSVIDEGIEAVSTEWGLISARHFNVTYEEGGVPVTLHFWIRNGIVIKADGSSMGLNVLIELTDTNLHEITG